LTAFLAALHQSIEPAPLLGQQPAGQPTFNLSSRPDGWYFTGDTGYFDAEGDLFVTGRVARRRCAGPRHCIAGGGRAFFERRRDQRLSRQLVLPVRRDGVDMPDSIKQPNALYVDLRDDADADQWQRLLGACGASLGATAPDWLMVRDQVLRLLQRDQSLNLVVAG
jgi:hypothetical protein